MILKQIFTIKSRPGGLICPVIILNAVSTFCLSGVDDLKSLSSWIFCTSCSLSWWSLFSEDENCWSLSTENLIFQLNLISIKRIKKKLFFFL